MKFGCKKALASVLCYACNKYGHNQADCPEAKYGALKVTPYKKARKTSKVRERSLIPPPSEELMKSIHAPGIKKDNEAKEAPKENKNQQGTILDDCFDNESSDDEDYIPLSEEEEMDDNMDEEMESIISENSLTHLNEDVNMSDTEHKSVTERPLSQQNILLNIPSSPSGVSPHNPTNNQ
jgi:hypothetical protein